MTVYNHKFFEHIYAMRKNNSAERSITFEFIIWLFKNRIFIGVLFLFEKVFTFFLTLSIPIYSDFVLLIITNIPGLPRFFGCYLRALYFKGKLKSMESNVIIEQGAIISHPQDVQLAEFSFIDKYVIIAAKTAKVGRRVHIAPFVIITGGGDFVIEDYACIATGSSIITSTETLKPGTRSSGPMVPFEQRDVLRGKVIIKKDAFIGAKATILTNVTVEAGAVVGAGVILSKNVRAWSINISPNNRPKQLRDRKKLELLDI